MPTMRRCSKDIPNIPHLYRGLGSVSIGLVALILIKLTVFSGCSLDISASETQPKGKSSYEMVTGETGEDFEDTRKHWDSVYNTKSYIFGKEPAQILKESLKFAPVGRALDIAMGEGRNTVFLAKKGFSSEGVDISDVALRKARRLAAENHVQIKTILADLTRYQITPETYSVIVNIDYLQKTLIPQIKRGLKKGGVIVYENFTVDQLKNSQGQHVRREFLLSPGELKEMFKEFEILVYRETNSGKEAKAYLVARKP